MSAPRLPDPRLPADAGRKRLVLRIAVWMFLATAVAILVLPLGLPKPVRLAVASTDLIAAAIIALLAHQRYSR